MNSQWFNWERTIQNNISHCIQTQCNTLYKCIPNKCLLSLLEPGVQLVPGVKGLITKHCARLLTTFQSRRYPPLIKFPYFFLFCFRFQPFLYFQSNWLLNSISSISLRSLAMGWASNNLVWYIQWRYLEFVVFGRNRKTTLVELVFECHKSVKVGEKFQNIVPTFSLSFWKSKSVLPPSIS